MGVEGFHDKVVIKGALKYFEDYPSSFTPFVDKQVGFLSPTIQSISQLTVVYGGSECPKHHEISEKATTLILHIQNTQTSTQPHRRVNLMFRCLDQTVLSIHLPMTQTQSFTPTVCSLTLADIDLKWICLRRLACYRKLLCLLSPSCVLRRLRGFGNNEDGSQKVSE